MADAAPGAGDVPIVLDGKEYKLVPTEGACLGISGIAGGLNAAVARCHNLDMKTICEVICFGLDATSAANRKEVSSLVYKTGLIHVAADAITFIRVVANGGQLPSEEDGDEGDRPLAGASALEPTT